MLKNLFNRFQRYSTVWMAFLARVSWIPNLKLAVVGEPIENEDFTRVGFHSKVRLHFKPFR